jgi:transcriptional regulator with XRE-family HTH domain
MTDVKAVFAQNLRVLRRHHNLSQMQLAQKCDVSMKFIQQLEAGRQFAAPRNLERIAEVLEVEPYQLIMAPSSTATSPTDKHRALSMLDRLERELIRDVRKRIESVRETL